MNEASQTNKIFVSRKKKLSKGLKLTAGHNDGDVIALIKKSYDDLSPKLQVIARYVIDYPYDFTLSPLNVVAARLKIPQSTVVRLAKYFGFSNGQSFRSAVNMALIMNFNYSNRIGLHQTPSTQAKEDSVTPDSLLQTMAYRNIEAIRQMESTLNRERLQRIVDMMVAAPSIYLVGVRRVFPLMMQMRYGLTHFRKRVFLIHGTGGMFREESESIDMNSLVFTVSQYPYSSEPIEIQKAAIEKKAQNVLVTDSELHPLFNQMDEAIIIRDAEFKGVRTLAASMTFMQSLVVAVGLNMREDDSQINKNSNENR